MRTVAVVLSFGRAELCELLACWARQTQPTPLVLWLDDAPSPLGELGELVHAHQAPKLGTGQSIGEVRAAAVNYARNLFRLGPHDAFMCLEDDDYYHPRHAEVTTGALRSAAWTGARRLGLQRERWQVPELLSSPRGPGQQGTWGLRLSAYDKAGGYNGVRLEDMDLVDRLGWQTCVPHSFCTHVRRELGFGMSALNHDREASRARSQLAPRIERAPWSGELAHLERWCADNMCPPF